LVTKYTGSGISRPLGIAVGSDGALWFTNYANNSIGRITTSGLVRNYTAATVDGPFDIAGGPDSALWFTNRAGNSIGRITS
jgi:virginiamycin B lyase